MASRTERQLLEDVEEYGWIGLRAPASGSRPNSATGDLWVGRKESSDKGEILTKMCIVEEKYSSTDEYSNRYVNEKVEKLEAMIDLAHVIGAIPLFAARWSVRTDWSPGSTHYITDARAIDTEENKYLSIKPETAKEEFETTEEFFCDFNERKSD